jgi:Spy/CpxP family protein refolding chaperone
MLKKRISSIVIGSALVILMVPALAMAADNTCGAEKGPSKVRSVEKVYRISKDGCEMATPEIQCETHCMSSTQSMGSCRNDHCAQAARSMCMNSGLACSPMMQGGARCMVESCGGPCGGTTRIQEILTSDEELKLTDEQRDRLREIDYAVSLAMLDLKTALAKEQLNLQKLIEDEAGLEEIAQQLKKVGTADYNLKIKNISSEREAMAVLTKEQQKILKAHKPPQILTWVGIDRPSCPNEIEVNVEKQDTPGEQRVIIIKDADDDADD